MLQVQPLSQTREEGVGVLRQDTAARSEIMAKSVWCFRFRAFRRVYVWSFLTILGQVDGSGGENECHCLLCLCLRWLLL